MCRLLQQYNKIPIAFGGASISGEGGGYGFGDMTEDYANALITHAFDRGIKVFDSAPIYGYGLSEKRLGKALKTVREDAFIISKSGVSWHDSKRVNMTNSPLETKKMLEQSLRDLDTDYIDLFMIHWPDKNVDIRRPMEVLSKAKNEGKIKHIGLCNTFDEDIDRALEVDQVEALQCQLNFFETEVVERLLVPYKDRKMSFMSWGTFDKGVLTGRVNKEKVFDKSDCRSWAPWWKAEKEKREEKYKIVSALQALVEKYDHTLLEMALASNFHSHESVDMSICGMRTIEQLDQTLYALSNLPSRDLLREWRDKVL